MRTEGRVFYGWWIILAAALGLLTHFGPIIVFTFGVFLKPLSQEFHWSRGEISLGFSLAALTAAVCSPLIGRLTDRFGARKVILPCTLVFGLGLISFYFLSAGLWHFYAIYLALGLVGGGTGPVPYSRLISHWFDKKRGLALGLTLVGAGLGQSIMPSVSQALIDGAGWRQAYVALGVTVVVVLIAVLRVLLRDTPQQMGLLPDGGTQPHAGGEKQLGEEQGMSRREAWRTGNFWLMFAAFFLMSGSIHGSITHMPPMLTDRGLSAQSAALAASLFGGASLLGRAVTGYLLDHFFAPYVAAGFFGGSALGILLLWSGAIGASAFGAAFLVGLGLGAEVDIMAYLVGRYFGLRAFGEIYGYAFAAFALAAAIGPLLMGIGFDFTGSYRSVLAMFVAATLAAAALMTRLGPYRTWEAEAAPG